MTKGNRHGEQQGNARVIGPAGTNPEGVAEIQDKSRFLEIQRDLASGLLHCAGLSECLGLLLESSIQLPGFDCGGVYLSNEDDGSLYLAAHSGLSADFVKHAARHDAGSPQARLVFSGALSYAFRSDLPAGLAEALAGEGIEFLAVLPLHDRGRVVGSLNVASRHSSQIDRDSKIMLECLVSQAEGAIGQITACEARRHAERQLRLAVEGAELGTWVADFETGTFEASSQAKALHGISGEFALNVETAMEAVHPEDRQRVAEELRKSFTRGEPFSCEYRTCLEAASAKWISSEGRFSNKQGSGHLYGIVQDITHCKHFESSLIESRDELERLVARRTSQLEEANAALRKQTERLELALDASQAGTWSWDIGNETTDWDNRNRRLFRFEDDIPVSVESFFARLLPADRDRMIARIDDLMLPGDRVDWNHEFRMQHPESGVRWLLGLGRVDRDESGAAIRLSGINFDITERKHAENTIREWNQNLERRVGERTAQLRQSQSRLQLLSEATFEGIAISEDGILIDANPQLAVIFGYDLGEMLGRFIKDFITPAPSALFAEISEGEQESTFEFLGFRKDGSTFPAEARTRMRTWQEKVTRVTAVRDLTSQKQAAARLKTLQAELDQAQRLAMVSEISAGIIHQIAQPLVSIGVNATTGLGICSDCRSDGCSFPAIMKEIESDVERMRGAFIHLRALADPYKPSRLEVDVNVLVEDVCRLLHHEAEGGKVGIALDLCRELPAIKANPVQLSQVLLNLVKNAIQACETCPAQQRSIVVTTRPKPAGGVEFSIRDSGSGIAPKAIECMFTPFFTTKPDGLGIGLRLSRTIVHAHGGSIVGFNNPDGPGATFRIVLPVGSEAGNTKV